EPLLVDKFVVGGDDVGANCPAVLAGEVDQAADHRQVGGGVAAALAVFVGDEGGVVAVGQEAVVGAADEGEGDRRFVGVGELARARASRGTVATAPVTARAAAAAGTARRMRPSDGPPCTRNRAATAGSGRLLRGGTRGRGGGRPAPTGAAVGSECHRSSRRSA